MSIGIWIDSIELASATPSTMVVDRNALIVLVGPNNSGKSTFLREIREAVSKNARHRPAGIVVRSATCLVEGTAEEFGKWCEVRFETVLRADGRHFRGLNFEVDEATIQSEWQTQRVHGTLGEYFCRFLDAANRLGLADSVGSIDYAVATPTHPLHFLFADDELERRISEAFRAAFGLDLVVDRMAGSLVRLRCGQRPVPLAGEDRVSRSYAIRVRTLPALQAQSDGMRSYAGILLATAVVEPFVLMIDEPETFLHPPQARLLGAWLAAAKRDERQLIVATHSGDFLRGLLNANAKHLEILRITRAGAVNRVTRLAPAAVATLWQDPILRFSNVLDGLFHEGVVICEGDADCRFYHAVSESIPESLTKPRKSDLMFTPCGGKDRIPVVLSALRRLEVPTAVIADIDALSGEQPLRAIYEAAGGSWSDISSEHQSINRTLTQLRPPLASGQAKQQIDDIFSRLTGPQLTEKAAEEIRTALRAVSPWASVKKSGIAAFPNGGPRTAVEKLLLALQAKGIFIVECGELENFAPWIGNHGPKWVAEVMQADIAHDDRFDHARKFVNSVLGYLQI